MSDKELKDQNNRFNKLFIMYVSEELEKRRNIDYNRNQIEVVTSKKEHTNLEVHQ